ncbi:MAG: hypothetical protein IPM24_10615 [Bryobacterales bacterium]|nr:hypothetical protein [Bryobacterales bacterium]
MLEKLNLKRELSEKEFRKMLPKLQRRLYDLEKAAWDNRIPSVIVFDGWDAAGKGSAVATLTARLDPRGFKVHPIQPPRTFERGRPWLWRFWLRTPNRGEIAIFDKSWYMRVLEERVEGRITDRECREAYRDIVDFERALADDGAAIIKFWLHISKKEQKRRFKQLEKDPLNAWRVSERDWERHEKYDEYLIAAERMFEMTDTEWGPWTIVEGTCQFWAQRKIFEHVIGVLEQHLGDRVPQPLDLAPEKEKQDAGLRAALDAAESAAGVM